MKERPILFSGPMVRAILEGRKSQTRRLLKVAPHPAVADWVLDSEFRAAARAHNEEVAEQYVSTFPHGRVLCPYGKPGDRLWVRETFSISGNGYFYRADTRQPETVKYSWKPSIFMPRTACRIVLEVTGVRVGRLQEISEADAKAEGVQHNHACFRDDFQSSIDNTDRRNYATLWDSLNVKRAPWSSNPWVWVVAFRGLTQ